MRDAAPLHVCFDAFELDEGNARLRCDGRPVSVPPKAFAVLCELARQPGQLVAKDALLDAVWGHQYLSESVLKTTISELRAALSDDARQPRYIETAARRGYRFVGIVRVPAESAPESLRAAPAGTGHLPASPGAGDHQLPLDAAPLLVGRDAALRRLEAAWQHAAEGRRQLVLVAGEPGIGKTALIDGFVSRRAAIACAYGQCVEQFGTGEPYLPVLEALGTLCREDPGLVALLRAVAPTWLVQLPWLNDEAGRATLRRELAGATQDSMLREMGELLERYTRDRSLLLVTEDLHWSDQATVQLIDHIARRRGPARLMWLASFRLAEVVAGDHPLKSLRHELRLHRLCEEIMLDSLAEQDVADYLGVRAPQLAASEDFVRALHARTDGIPLFLTNVVDDLDAQGLLDPRIAGPEAAARVPHDVPASLAGVIEKQMERLSADQHAVLAAASVCGVEFRPVTVADALGRDPGTVDRCCDELACRQHWLGSATIERRPDGALEARYAFRHALYRQVFYDHLGALARAQLHERVAASLERGRAAGMAVTAAELASHYERSHNPVAALRYYAEAAENALRHFAPSEAMTLTAHALALIDNADRDPRSATRNALELTLLALHGVAAAQVLGVSSLAAKRPFERARGLLDALPQHPLRGLVLHGLGLVLMVRGEYAEGKALGERIQALAARLDDRVLYASACNILGQIATLQGRNLEAQQWLEAGVATCDALGDEVLQAAFVVDPEVTMEAALAIPLLHRGLVAQGRARLARAVARAERLGQPMVRMVASWFGGLFEVRLGNAERVAALADSLRAIVDSAALAQGRAPSEWFRGWAEARLGSPREAYRRIRAAYDHNAGLGMFSGGTEVLGYASEALVLAGEWDAAQAEVAEAMALAGRLGERVYLTQLHLVEGDIARGRGDAAGERRALDSALAEACAQQAPWLELTVRVARCAHASPTPADRKALADCCAALTDAQDTPLYARAQALVAGNGQR